MSGQALPDRAPPPSAGAQVSPGLALGPQAHYGRHGHEIHHLGPGLIQPLPS